MSNTSSFVVCAVYSVKNHHELQIYSPRLKNICIRQAVFDKWLPLISCAGAPCFTTRDMDVQQLTVHLFLVASNHRVLSESASQCSLSLHRIASHRIPSHRIASHRIASHRIASHRITCVISLPYLSSHCTLRVGGPVQPVWPVRLAPPPVTVRSSLQVTSLEDSKNTVTGYCLDIPRCEEWLNNQKQHNKHSTSKVYDSKNG